MRTLTEVKLELEQLMQQIDEASFKADKVYRMVLSMQGSKKCFICQQPLGDNYVDDICPNCSNHPRGGSCG